MITQMTQQGEIKERLLEETGEAANYLDLPLLAVISHPLFQPMRSFAPTTNLYRPETFGQLLAWAIINNFEALFRHILRMSEPGNPMESQGLVLAVSLRPVNLIYIKCLLSRVDAVTARVHPSVIQLWCPQHPTLLGEPLSANPSTHQVFHIAAYYACIFNDTTVLKCLRLEDMPIEILVYAMRQKASPVVDFLLSEPNFDLNRSLPVKFGSREGKISLMLYVAGVAGLGLPYMRLLARCPRLDLSDELRREILNDPGWDFDAAQWCLRLSQN